MRKSKEEGLFSGIGKKLSISRRGFVKGTIAAGAVTASTMASLPMFSAHAALTPQVNDLPKKWDYSTDVLIIGGGSSGLSAAVEATRKGVKAMMIEKRPRVGGDLIISSGVFYSAKTKYHTEAGITKNVEPEDYWAYLASGLDDEPLKRVRDNQQFSPVYAAITKHDPSLMKNNALASPSVIEFISNFGVEFHPMNPVKPFQLNSKSGNMGVLVGNMVKELQSSGLQLMTDTRADKLYVDQKGRVVGVRAKNASGKEINIKSKTTILATGGFLDNEYLMKRYQPYWYTVPAGHYSPGKGIPTDHTGDGIMMGKAINASLEDMDAGCKLHAGVIGNVTRISWLLFDTEVAYLVNEKGVRVTNEVAARYSGCALAILHTKSKAGYAVFDNQFFNGPAGERYKLKKALEDGGLFTANTPEELAAKVGIDAKGLNETINRINKDASSGTDTQFGKSGATFKPLQPPYYITAPYSPVRYSTEGGLETNVNYQVLEHTEENVIPGLYAVGVGVGSITSRLLDCINSGRIAGRNAAEEAKRS